MTEDEWLNSPHPIPRLEFLSGRASDRKLRLFSVAFCRQHEVWRHLNDQSKAIVEASESFADNGDGWDRIIKLASAAPQGRAHKNRSYKTVRILPYAQAERAALSLAVNYAWEAAWKTTRDGLNLLGPTVCELIRDIFGNPFRTTIPRDEVSLVATNQAEVVQLAQGIYQERTFEMLSIVAEALESAGCNNNDMLQHCRSKGPHSRGCWVVDMILGKS